jgi:hypothetical protein
LEKEQSLADVYGALGNIYASIGLDPVTGGIENVTVRTLEVQLKKTLDSWFNGYLPKLPKPVIAKTLVPVKQAGQ